MLYLLNAPMDIIFLSFAAYIFFVGTQIKEVNPRRIDFSWTKICLALFTSLIIWDVSLTLFATLTLLFRINNNSPQKTTVVLYKTRDKCFCTLQEALDSVDLDVVLVEVIYSIPGFGFKSRGISAYQK